MYAYFIFQPLTYIPKYICTYVYIDIHIHVYVYIYIYVHVYTRVCMCLPLLTCIYVYLRFGPIFNPFPVVGSVLYATGA